MRGKRPLLAALCCIALVGCDFSSKGEAIGAYENPRKALIVMDMQKDFIGDDARMPVSKEQIPGLILTVNGLIEAYESNGDLIVYVRNVFPKNEIANLFRNNAAVEGSAGIELDERILFASGAVFDKKAPDAFGNPEFEQFLIENRINDLTFTGVFADQCVFYTAKSALNRKYTVRFVQNGVAAGSDRAIQRAAGELERLDAIIVNE